MTEAIIRAITHALKFDNKEVIKYEKRTLSRMSAPQAHLS